MKVLVKGIEYEVESVWFGGKVTPKQDIVENGNVVLSSQKQYVPVTVWWCEEEQRSFVSVLCDDGVLRTFEIEIFDIVP